MKKDDYVAIDVRWQNAGWTEAFRLRLTEWLPQEEITIGIENGVLEPVAGFGNSRTSISVIPGQAFR